jgi:flagellar hook-length control protein FliK
MQAGIEALMDAAAPPVRAPRDAPAPPDSLSFDDHLHAAAPSPPEPKQSAETSAEDEAPPAEPAQDGAYEPEPTQAAAPPPQNCAPPANPITLQIIDAIDAAVAPAADAKAAQAEAAPPQQSAQIPPTAPLNAANAKPHAAKSRNAGDAAGEPPETARPPDTIETELNTDAPKPADAAKHVASSEPPQSAAPPPQQPPQSTAPPQQHVAHASIAAAPVAKPAPAPAGESAASIGDVTAPSKDAGPAAPPQKQDLAAVEEPNTRQPDAAAPTTNHKQSGAAAAPTAAPREPFTALLAQQENAIQAPASHPAIGATALGASTDTTALATPHAAAMAAPAAQVGREIIRKFNGGNTRFELRLDPPELGRVEVKLEVSRDHRVTAIVGADSPQALAELTRHARDIEQALQSAGLELSDEGLSFDLSQHREDFADGREQQGGRGAQTTAAEETGPISSRALTLDAWRGARVDLVT